MFLFFLTLKKGNEWVWHVIDKCAAHGNHQAQWGQKIYVKREHIQIKFS